MGASVCKSEHAKEATVDSPKSRFPKEPPPLVGAKMIPNVDGSHYKYFENDAEASQAAEVWIESRK